MRSKESETPCSKIPLFLIKKPILKTVSLLIVVLIELLISLFLFWSVIFKVYYLSFFAFSFSVLLIPVKLHDKKLWISRISTLCILFLILNLTLWIPVKTIDHRIKELSDKYVYSKAYRELTIKDKIGIYGLNILMGLAAYPIYPEVSKETLYLIFPAPGDKIRVFDGRGFLGSWKIRKILRDVMNSVDSNASNTEKIFHRRLSWETSDYMFGHLEARYALALNGGTATIKAKKKGKRSIFEVTLKIYVKYPRKGYVLLLKQPKLRVEEGLFWRLQEAGWLHPYWAEWKFTVETKMIK